jgi:hypothetical protein
VKYVFKNNIHAIFFQTFYTQILKPFFNFLKIVLKFSIIIKIHFWSNWKSIFSFEEKNHLFQVIGPIVNQIPENEKCIHIQDIFRSNMIISDFNWPIIDFNNPEILFKKLVKAHFLSNKEDFYLLFQEGIQTSQMWFHNNHESLFRVIVKT